MIAAPAKAEPVNFWYSTANGGSISVSRQGASYLIYYDGPDLGREESDCSDRLMHCLNLFGVPILVPRILKPGTWTWDGHRYSFEPISKGRFVELIGDLEGNAIAQVYYSRLHGVERIVITSSSPAFASVRERSPIVLQSRSGLFSGSSEALRKRRTTAAH